MEMLSLAVTYCVALHGVKSDLTRFISFCLFICTLSAPTSASKFVARVERRDRYHLKRAVHGCRHGIRFRLLSYEPSQWEQNWSETLSSGREPACAYIKENSDAMTVWLNTIQEINNGVQTLGSAFKAEKTKFSFEVPSRTEAALYNVSSKVFSVFIFENECPGSLHGLKKRVFIEPLVGHMRHPLALKQCTSPQQSQVDAMDTSYLLLNPWPSPTFQLLYPGKRYLLDCGTSTFDTSLMFLTTRYRQSGIEFDEIWAWEAQEQSARSYWEGVPDIYKSRLHYYNEPITSAITAPDHPISIIRTIYRPGDFIALKLDIDNSSLETAFVDAIANDEDLLRSIGEMFFEQHYDHEEMAYHFPIGTNNGVTLTSAYRKLSKLRELGLLVHYWP